MFIPKGVPLILLPFLVIIEIISHIAKVFSLAIRLFANMMSGHILLHILTGFALILGQINLTYIFLPLLLILFIILLEFGIALLQAYVFITLLAIYFEEHFNFTSIDLIFLINLFTINNLKSYIYFKFCFLKLKLKKNLKKKSLIKFSKSKKKFLIFKAVRIKLKTNKNKNFTKNFI